MSSSYNSISSFSTLPVLLSDAGAGVRPNNFNRGQETMIRQPNSVASPPKKRRNQPGNPSPEADVIALSPEMIMTTKRFIWELCKEGFPREQNLQIHRRGHNLPYQLKQNSNKEVRRKVYLCPEPSCVHHDPSRAIGDLTGIRKHYYRKHGEKTLECDICPKRYAVESDRKAHFNAVHEEYLCECGTISTGRDRDKMHRKVCQGLIGESPTNPTVSSTAMADAAGGGGRHGFYGSAASTLSDHNHFGNSSTSGFAPLAAGYNRESEEFVPRSANPNPRDHANFGDDFGDADDGNFQGLMKFLDALIEESPTNPTMSSTAMAAAAGGGGRHGFYGSAASTLSYHNHFGNSSTSGFAPLVAGYNLESEEFVPRSANPNPGDHANFGDDFGDDDDGNLQRLMNSLGAPTDNQSWSGGLFDPGFGNNLSMGGSDRLNLDFLGVNGGNVSTINGRGGRNGAPLDTEMKFSLPNYPFGKTLR